MPLVDLVVEDPVWETALPGLSGLVETAARTALIEAGLAPDDFELCLLACDDARIAALNAAFRETERPTNVLSWPAMDLSYPGPAGPKLPPRSPDMPRLMLGDVALAFQTVRFEADSARLPLKDHATHLIVHGVLHLLGYDHAHDAEAERMEALEKRALARIGIRDPYDRAGDVTAPQE